MKLGVDTTNASVAPGFYRTEGLKRTLPAGSLAVQADVFAPSSWKTTSVRAGLWGVGAKSDGSVSSYPIIEFTTIGENGFTGWRWWDGDNGGWYNLDGTSYKVNEWNRLGIVVNGSNFDFYVNGKRVATQASPDSVALGAAILNSFNPADQGANYDVYWSKFAIGREALSLAAKSQCSQDGWKNFWFVNAGQCVRFVENGKNSRL